MLIPLIVVVVLFGEKRIKKSDLKRITTNISVTAKEKTKIRKKKIKKEERKRKMQEI